MTIYESSLSIIYRNNSKRGFFVRESFSNIAFLMTSGE